MADKIIAPIALLLLVVFLAFLAVYIDEIDLWVVFVLVSAMAAFDFWQTLRKPENGSGA
jgi:hypothetical protein